MYTIGIDPGITGAIGVLENNNFIAVDDMPTTAYTGNRQRINPVELSKLLEFYTSEDIPMAVIENVHAMPKQGGASNFSFGMTYGVILGVVGSLRIPYILVTPQQWKKRANLTGKPKDYARTLAQQLFPKAELGRKKDIGRADALLIARFGIKGDY